MIEITVKTESKEYKANFDYPTFGIYQTFYRNITNSFVADTTFAKDCFKSGDEEMIDFENHIDLFLSYRNELYNLLADKEKKVILIPNIEKSIVAFELEDGDKKYKGYFKKPDFQTTKRLIDLYDDGELFKAKLLMARKCILEDESDMELIQFMKKPEYFTSYMPFLSDMLQLGVVTLKKK